MTLRELLAQTAPAAAARVDEPGFAAATDDDQASDAPLIVRIFLVGGTWIGALLVAVLIAAFEIQEVPALAFVIGLALFGGAIVASRREARSLAVGQLVWIGTVGGHAAWLAALVELGVREKPILVAWTVLNLVVALVMRSASVATVSAAASVVFATGASQAFDVSPLWVALPFAVVTTALWLFEAQLAPRLGRAFAAFAYGLPVGVAVPLVLAVPVWDHSLVAAGRVAATAATCVLASMVVAVAWVARRELGQPLDRRAVALLSLAVVAALAARHVPGVTLGVLLLLLAEVGRSVGLRVIGVAELGGFLFHFYYQMDTPLLQKSLWVLSAGVVVGIVGALTRSKRSPQHQGPPRKLVPAVVLVCAIAGLVGGSAIAKEHTLAHGRRVVLPLAPVDPRSLMQGDYLTLRYALEEEVRTAIGDSADWVAPSASRIPRHGHLVLRVGPSDVAHFVRVDSGGALAPEEVRIEHRVRGTSWGGWLRVGAESYFFEEGTADRYDDAKYGVLRVAPSGEVVLAGLLDTRGRPLGRRR